MVIVWCAWCEVRIEGTPNDDDGRTYHRLCHDMRRAVLARESERASEPDARDC